MFKQIYYHLNLNNENIFNNYKKQINESNYKSLLYLINTIIVFSFVSFGASLIFTSLKKSTIDYLLLFAFSILYMLFLKKFKIKKNAIKILYFYIFIVSIFFMITGIILNPISTCTFLCVLIVMIPIFILDNHINIIIFNTIISILGIVLSCYYKNITFFYIDLLNIIGTYLLSMFLTLFLIESKISDIKIKLELKDTSQKDQLTKLYNRNVIPDLINNYLIEPEGNYSLVIFDLDNFKSINDTYGHHTGDIVLKSVANVLTTTFRSNDTIIRLGGDEFIVFMKNIKEKEIIKKKADELIKNINTKVEVSKGKYISCSAGIIYSNKKSTFKALYKKADAAMYEAKKLGKNKHIIIYD